MEKLTRVDQLPQPWAGCAVHLVQLPTADGVVVAHCILGEVHRLLCNPETGLSLGLEFLRGKVTQPGIGAQCTVKFGGAPGLFAELRGHGAVGASANTLSLVPLASVQKALASLGMLTTSVQPLFDAIQQHIMGATASVPSTSAVGAPHPQHASSLCTPSPSTAPSPPPCTAPPTMPLPSSLPECPVEGAGLRARYGLPKEQVPQSLQLELGAFQGWCMGGVVLDRLGYKALSRVTWEHLLSYILGFLGFLVKHAGYAIPALSLTLFAIPSNLAGMAAFLVARGVLGTGIALQVGAWSRVVQYLLARGAPSTAAHLQPSHLQKLQPWLDTLAKQVPSAAKVSSWDRDGGQDLPSAQVLLHWVLATQKTMLTSLHEFGGRWGSEAKALACDLAFLQFTFGWIPPLRVKTLQTLLHPVSSQAGGGGGAGAPRKVCQAEGCRFQGCKGNRLQWVDPLDHSRGLLAVVPHHKTQEKLAGPPIQFELPPGMVAKLLPHLEHCGATARRPLLFATPDRRPLSDPAMSAWFPRLQREYSAPWLGQGGHIPLQKCRHVFVNDTVGARGDGSLSEAAARAMGSSLAAWGRYYDKKRVSREMQAAVQFSCQRRMELGGLSLGERSSSGEEDEEEAVSTEGGSPEVEAQEEEWEGISEGGPSVVEGPSEGGSSEVVEQSGCGSGDEESCGEEEAQ